MWCVKPETRTAIIECPCREGLPNTDDVGVDELSPRLDRGKGRIMGKPKVWHAFEDWFLRKMDGVLSSRRSTYTFPSSEFTAL
jgi:hypothetical protein